MEIKLSETIFVDTAPLIYFFEDNKRYAEKVAGIFAVALKKRVQIVTSMITYVELLTMPQKAGNKLLAAKYRDYLTNSEEVSIYPMSITVADKTVELRAQYNLKTPDAIQLATSIICGADHVLTNDKKWKVVEECNIVLLDQL